MNDSPRPPYVTFEVRAIEDREQSIAEGRYMARDVVFAIVTPTGTKDRVEKPVEDWLHSIEEGVRQERIPSEWLSAYRKAYENFQENRESPEFGTPIADYPALSPAQVRMLQDIGIRTVEDLADASEEAVSRIGMGARGLKAKAEAWIEASKGLGQVAAKLDELRHENAELKARDEEREARLATLERQLEAMKPADPAKVKKPETVDKD